MFCLKSRREYHRAYVLLLSSLTVMMSACGGYDASFRGTWEFDAAETVRQNAISGPEAENILKMETESHRLVFTRSAVVEYHNGYGVTNQCLPFQSSSTSITLRTWSELQETTIDVHFIVAGKNMMYVESKTWPYKEYYRRSH